MKPLTAFIKINLIFILFWINLGFCGQTLSIEGQVIVAEGKASIVKGDIRSAHEQALNNAMEDAITKALCLVLPNPDKLIKNPQDFVISYGILQQDYTDYYHLQIEVKIDWERLARALDTKGILSTGNGERVLLSLNLPLADVDFRPQILPIWERFFLVFGLRPIRAQIGEDKLLDYAYKSGIPLIFSFSLKVGSVPKGWQLMAKGRLIETIHQKIVATAMGKSSVMAQETGTIGALVQSGQDLASSLALRLASQLHLWLKKQKQNIHKVSLRVSGIHNYPEVFTLLQTFREIGGIRYVCLREISANEVVYEGYYSNPIPYLLNELTARGFSIDGVKRGRIFLHR